MEATSHTTTWRRVLIGGIASLLVAAAGASQGGAAAGPLLIASDTTLSEDYNGEIVVVAKGTVLDCDGHAVLGAGSGVGINVIADHVTVRDCRVHGFETGILTAQDGTRIVDNETTNNDQGIRLAGAVNSRVAKNDASHNADWGIIAAQEATDNTIERNSANANGLIGVAMNQASNNLVARNEANGNGNAGFDASFASSGNRIVKNSANANRVVGFAFSLSSNDNTIAKNAAIDDGTPANGCGFCFSDSSRNTVTENVALRSGGVGFFLFFKSELNVFTENRACGSFFVDAADHGTGVGNTWSENSFCTSEGGLS